MQQVLQSLQIQHVRVQHLMQFGVLQGQRRAADGDDFLHVGGQQALAQNALTDHASGTE